jgi:hypothetical protein
MHYEIPRRGEEKFKVHAMSLSTVGEINATYQQLEPKAESLRPHMALPIASNSPKEGILAGNQALPGFLA